MFNETIYSSMLGDFGVAPGCEAADAECIKRFPEASPDAPWSEAARQNHLYLQCMDAIKCGGSVTGHDQPGATTYPIDVVTNPSNPDYVFPDFGLGKLNTPVIIAAGAVLVLLLLRR